MPKDISTPAFYTAWFTASLMPVSLDMWYCTNVMVMMRVVIIIITIFIISGVCIAGSQ